MQQTRESQNIYEKGGSSRASASDASRPQDIDFNLRSTYVDLVRSKSAKQPKIIEVEVGQGVKCPTPYEILIVCLKVEYNNMREWIKTLKCTWKETGVNDNV
ncbi:hypothetical protein Lal_00016999 [Lupinus albus]|nr:hypothetical protein Lal_00016999 [Lupinus albus]